MGALERKDIATDEALMAPLILRDNLLAYMKSQDDVIANSKKLSDSLPKGSVDDVKKSIADLIAEEILLVKVQRQIQTEEAKNTDAYRASVEQLRRLKDENKLAQAQSDSWVRSVTEQNSSLIQLEQALNKNRIAYANLRTESERNSKSGQDLLKIIQNQDTSVKNLRDSMGQAQAHVGGYREEIERLIPTLRRISPETASSAESFVLLEEKASIFSTGLALGLGAVAVGIATVTALYETGKYAVEKYFEDSVEGADRGNKVLAVYSATVEVIKDKFEDLGKKIVTVLDNPRTQSGILSSIIAIAPVLSGIVTLLAKQTGILDDIRERYKAAKELADAQNAIKKEEIVLTTEIAEIELRKNQALFESRDKLRKSDQERFDAALNVGKAIDEEVDKKLKANDKEQEAQRSLLKLRGANLTIEQTSKDIINGTVAIQKASYEDVEKLAQLEAKRINIQQEQYQGQRRTLQVLDTIVQESEKHELSSQKIIQEATIKSRETTYKELVNINQRIVGNQQNSVEDQIKAQETLTQAEIGLADLAASKELVSAKEAALGRIKLTSDELEAIYNLSEGDLSKLVRLTLEKKEEKLAVDKAYADQSSVIIQTSQFEQERLLQQGADKQAKIIADSFKSASDLKKSIIQRDADIETAALNKNFLDGQISIGNYERQKKQIERQVANETAKAEADEYAQAIDRLIAYYSTKTELTQGEFDLLKQLRDAYSKALKDADQKDVDNSIAIHQKLKTQLISIQNQLIDAIQAKNDNIYASEVQSSQDRINNLTKEKDAELKAAGDNKKAQAEIERNYTKLVDEETAKQNYIKYKQALFDKRMSELKVITSVAAGIAKAYEDYNYIIATVISALIAAVGVAQISAIESAPLPAYAEGTGDHPGGPAIVGEDGSELVYSPGHGFALTPEVATMVDLPAGSAVISHDATRALALEGLINGSYNGGAMVSVTLDDSRILEKLDQVAQSIPHLDEQLGVLHRVFKNQNGSRRWERSKYLFR